MQTKNDKSKITDIYLTINTKKSIKTLKKEMKKEKYI